MRTEDPELWNYSLNCSWWLPGGAGTVILNQIFFFEKNIRKSPTILSFGKGNPQVTIINWVPK
jgi:hypothetical protein